MLVLILLSSCFLSLFFLFARVGVQYFGHFLGAPREPRQIEAARGNRFNYRRFRQSKGPPVPLMGAPFPLRGGGDLFPLRALVNRLIVGQGVGAFNCQGSGVSLKHRTPARVLHIHGARDVCCPHFRQMFHM